MRRIGLLAWALCSATAVRAADVPSYGPAAAWIVPAAPLDAKAGADQAILAFETQQRIEKGVTTAYVETAFRATTAQALSQLGSLTIPWMPDRGGLTLHVVEIVRPDGKVDLLKNGKRFVILRREEQLEQRMLTGLLTATMQVEGLQIGDIVHVAFSITQSDKALGGNAVAGMLTPVAPFPLSSGHARLVWPAGEKVAWRAYGTGAVVTERDQGGDHEVSVALPLPRAPEMPGDQPGRFTPPPLLEATTFASWEDVSRTLAPLYATSGLIAPGSALAGEMKRIAAAESDPLRRTQAALALVQDKVRYLAMAMNGGGLTPQSPAQTWELRYGDCKAKTLLLLALLHGLGIEAEPVAASVQLSAFVEKRLPTAAAFDHILVRATVAGATLWLDGTGAGAMLADINDTPGFRYVLPVRVAGSTLMPLPTHADARPSSVVAIDYDQRAGIRFPTLFDASVTLRGRQAEMLKTAAGSADAKQKAELLDGIVTSETGEANIARRDVRFDQATGTATVTASGLMTTPWQRDERRYRFPLDRVVGALSFAPDRARATWRELPVATGGPESIVYRTTVKLPDEGRGFVFEGATTLPPALAGRQVKRTAALTNGVVVIEDRIDATGAEIAPAELSAARSAFASASTRALRLIAPATATDRVAALATAQQRGTLRPIEASYAAAIADDPDDARPYVNRANFRRVYDNKGAIADFTKAIALEDSVATRFARGSAYAQAGDDKAALADYEAARAIDPADLHVLTALARQRGRLGDAKGAVALLDERLSDGGTDRAGLISAKADLLADTGDAAEAIALIDNELAERPGSGSLLNQRCWIKGTRKLAVDSAVKDCTRAIESSDNPVAALDSRAMAYWRLGRLDEALEDLNAVLLREPEMAASRFMRAVVLKQQGKAAAAATDLAAARLLSPRIDVEYARYGVAP